jgi:hypothetical protein
MQLRCAQMDTLFGLIAVIAMHWKAVEGRGRPWTKPSSKSRPYERRFYGIICTTRFGQSYISIVQKRMQIHKHQFSLRQAPDQCSK